MTAQQTTTANYIRLDEAETAIDNHENRITFNEGIILDHSRYN